MVEIEEINSPNSNSVFYKLLIDGTPVDEKVVDVSTESIAVFSLEVGEKLAAHRLCDLPAVAFLQFKYQFEGLEIVDSISISTPTPEPTTHSLSILRLILRIGKEPTVIASIATN